MSEVPDSIPSKPTTRSELFCFYEKYFKPLYADIESQGEFPQAIGFEALAAIDHLKRYYVENQDESLAVEKAAGHLKRGAFDLFKLRVLRAQEQYDELRDINTSIIEHGEFDKQLHQLFSDIRAGGSRARLKEGDAESWGHGFDYWWPVYRKCVEFEQQYFLHDKIPWAERQETKRQTIAMTKSFGIGIAAGVLSGIILEVVTSVGSIALSVIPFFSE